MVLVYDQVRPPPNPFIVIILNMSHPWPLSQQEQRIRLGVTELGDPVPGEDRDGVSGPQRMFEKHRHSFTRIRQLAEPPERAMALGHGIRFNDDGAPTLPDARC